MLIKYNLNLNFAVNSSYVLYKNHIKWFQYKSRLTQPDAL